MMMRHLVRGGFYENLSQHLGSAGCRSRGPGRHYQSGRGRRPTRHVVGPAVGAASRGHEGPRWPHQTHESRLLPTFYIPSLAYPGRSLNQSQSPALRIGVTSP
ncbi:unnamed protein product [Vitrella brassicaformis CCMP3155]|uniref:Uncharacterized protein n=1 Tax=Vitrella brassicaformis (strain CCMP3155) TaxID=1169540 RepID=A0A0G4F215_VITBC|nr:unnamed protein product [Vitrella brassicaformis CCMP3155]|eukprot:CEM05389.1 unnamed protein product [Vitrella brassicaformis CCMP3155]